MHGIREKIERIRGRSLNQGRGNDRWINPLLTHLDLVRKREEDLSPNAC
jgi:hypothetical protein